MTEYLVRWEVELDADTPEEAALEAYNMVAAPDTLATCFDVLDPSDESLIEQIDVRKAAS